MEKEACKCDTSCRPEKKELPKVKSIAVIMENGEVTRYYKGIAVLFDDENETRTEIRLDVSRMEQVGIATRLLKEGLE